MLQGHRLHCLTILGRPSCGLTPRKVAVFPAVRSEAIGTKRARAYATDVRSWWKLTYERSGGIRVLPSRPGEFHPEPLTDPDLNLSIHPARATDEGLPPFVKAAGSSCCQLAHYGSEVDGLPASLHGHYSASSLLPGSPSLSIASVLSLSCFSPLVASPLPSTPRFSCSIRPPLLGSGHLYAGCRSVRKQVPPELIPESSSYAGFDIV